MNQNATIYQFSRDKVERGDFSHFLELYGPENLPSGAALGAMMNTLVLAVDGYDDDPREIYLIPEVRQFFADFQRAWPYLPYFANLDTENLMIDVMCLLPSIATIKRDGDAVAGVEYDRMELVNYLRNGFTPLNLMCERAGLSEREIYDRTKALFLYFDFPFDAPAPE